MSRNGNKHISHRESCKRYTNSGRCEVNRQQRIKRAAEGKKEPSRKMAETPLMMWARVIKNCPKGGTVNEIDEAIKRHLTADEMDGANLGWPRRYWGFGALHSWQKKRVARNKAVAKANKKKETVNA